MKTVFASRWRLLKKLFTILIAIGFLIFVLLFIKNNSILTNSNLTLNQERAFISFLKVEPPIDFIPVNLKITAIGDSLTVGVGATEKEGGYLNYIKSHLTEAKGVRNTEITNLAKTGLRSDELIKLLKQAEVKSQISNTDIVLITIGGNDLMKVFTDHIINLELPVFERELVQFKQRLREIITTIKGYNENISILLIGFYNPFNEWLGQITEVQMIMDQWTTAGREIVSEYENAYFVNIADAFSKHGIDVLYEDYFHPNDSGYDLIGKETMDVILANIDTILTARKVTLQYEKN